MEEETETLVRNKVNATTTTSKGEDASKVNVLAILISDPANHTSMRRINKGTPLPIRKMKGSISRIRKQQRKEK